MGWVLMEKVRFDRTVENEGKGLMLMENKIQRKIQEETLKWLEGTGDQSWLLDLTYDEIKWKGCIIIVKKWHVSID